MQQAPQAESPGIELDRYALEAMILARCRRPLGHEMKNAVQGLYSGIEILTKVIEPSSKSKVTAAECVALLKRQLDGLQQRLARILDDIAAPDDKPTQFDICAVIRDVAGFLMSDAAVANVRMQVQAQDPVMVFGRVSLLKRILLGFFLDAIDAMRGDGTLHLQVASMPGSVVVELSDSRLQLRALRSGSPPESTIDGALLRRLSQRLMSAEGGDCQFMQRPEEGLTTRLSLMVGTSVA